MLGCLVASMTMGAALLDWVQPNHMDADTPRRQLIAQIRSSINSSAEGSTLADKWQTIRAVPVTAADQSRVHFVVDRDGNWSPTAHWKNQLPVSEAGVIRIGLRTMADSGEITNVQWGATCQLRNNLQEMYKITLERFIPSPNLRLPTESKDKAPTQ
jgi:hypothetical protein